MTTNRAANAKKPPAAARPANANPPATRAAFMGTTARCMINMIATQIPAAVLGNIANRNSAIEVEAKAAGLNNGVKAKDSIINAIEKTSADIQALLTNLNLPRNPNAAQMYQYFMQSFPGLNEKVLESKKQQEELSQAIKEAITHFKKEKKGLAELKPDEIAALKPAEIAAMLTNDKKKFRDLTTRSDRLEINVAALATESVKFKDSVANAAASTISKPITTPTHRLE